MPSATSFQKYLAEQLNPGERVEFVTAAGPKAPGGSSDVAEAGKRAAGSIAKSVAITAATSAVAAGTGVMVLRSMPAVWVVITDQRVLMFGKRGDRGARAIGAPVFARMRKELETTLKTGLLANSVMFRDSETGEELVRLRTGARRGAAVKISASGTGD